MPPRLKRVFAFACMFVAWPLLVVGDVFARTAGSLLDAAAHLAGKE